MKNKVNKQLEEHGAIGWRYHDEAGNKVVIKNDNGDEIVVAEDYVEHTSFTGEPSPLDLKALEAAESISGIIKGWSMLKEAVEHEEQIETTKKIDSNKLTLLAGIFLVVAGLLMITYLIITPGSVPNEEGLAPGLGAGVATAPELSDPEYEGYVITFFTKDFSVPMILSTLSDNSSNAISNSKEVISVVMIDNKIDLSTASEIEIEYRSQDSKGDIDVYILEGKVELTDDEFADVKAQTAQLTEGKALGDELIVKNGDNYFKFNKK